MCVPTRPGVVMRPVKNGFTLVELLVVLVIIGILLAIALKGLVGKQGQRQLTASIDTFASDMRWARTQAAKTGNTLYVAFLYSPDAGQLLPPGSTQDPINEDPSNFSQKVWGTGVAIPPDNPGIRRACKGYVVVEARPRFHAGPPPPNVRNNPANSSGYLWSEWGSLAADGVKYAVSAGKPYTYRDLLGDLWMATEGYPGSYSPPLEPIYPRNDALTNKLLDEASVARDDANVNSDSVPLIFYPFQLYGDSSSGTTYQVSSGFLGDDYTTAVANDDLAFFRSPSVQACKVFDTANRNEIIQYNVNYRGANAETKTLADGSVVEDQRYDEDQGDHPRMNDQIVDYVQILRRDLPEHVLLVNPYKARFLVYHSGNPNAANGVYRETFQFLQYLIAIDPQGKMALKQWDFNPEYFPQGSPQNDANLVHGNVEERTGIPLVRTVFMVTDDALDFNGASAQIAVNAAANLEADGRTFTYWPLSGKYYVDAYPPNDKLFFIADNDNRLNIMNAASGFGKYIPSYGYQRNYLVP